MKKLNKVLGKKIDTVEIWWGLDNEEAAKESEEISLYYDEVINFMKGNYGQDDFHNLIM